MNICLSFCSLSWSERVLTASQPGSKLVQMGFKHPRKELTHELPRGKLAFKMQTVMVKKFCPALQSNKPLCVSFVFLGLS